MYGYIYLTTNLVNGKKYIGKHKAEKLDESYKGTGTLILRAIKKYGNGNFSCEILEECNTLEELNEKEKFYINFYNCVADDNYYNLTYGGSGGSVKGIYKHTDENKRWFSEHQKGHANHIQTDVEKEKRSESLKKSYIEGRHAVIRKGFPKGQKRTPEDIEANRKRNKNKVWVKKDGKGTTISKEELQKYLTDGWEQGRPKYNSTAWNKGLTKDTNESVLKISETRKKLFEEKGSIGCYGLKGQENKNSKTNKI